MKFSVYALLGFSLFFSLYSPAKDIPIPPGESTTVKPGDITEDTTFFCTTGARKVCGNPRANGFGSYFCDLILVTPGTPETILNTYRSVTSTDDCLRRCAARGPSARRAPPGPSIDRSGQSWEESCKETWRPGCP